MNNANYTQQPKWQEAETTLATTYEQKQANREIEMAYHKALQRLKSLYIGSGKRVYERNHKMNRSSQACAIHDFRTDEVTWYLRCDQLHNYKISYQLFNGERKSKIKSIISFVKPKTAVEESMLSISLESVLERFKDEAIFLNTIE